MAATDRRVSTSRRVAAGRVGSRHAATRRSGFTLAEVLVALAIMALIGAALIPSIRSRLTTASADALGGELRTLQQGILAFRTNTGRWPQSLTFLTFAPSGSTTDVCGAAITGTNYLNYRGPYVSRDITGNYVVADDDTVNVLLTRSPVASNPLVKQYLRISVSGVEQEEAEILERAYDGPDASFDYTSGTILWTQNPTGSQGTLQYQMPITGC